MTVELSEGVADEIRIDLTEDRGLADENAFQEALLAFSVTSREPDSVTIHAGDDIFEAVQFITDAISSVGSTVRLSRGLTNLMARRNRERQLVSNIQKAHAVPSVQGHLPKNIPGLSPEVILLPHQTRGILQALRVENLAEFSVQGAGKTLMVLTAFSLWKAKGEVQKLLVVGPVSSHKPWQDEVKRWLPQAPPCLRWSGSLRQRTRLVPKFASSEIILCTYDTAVRDADMLCELLRAHSTLLVLDESHYFKNFRSSARATAAFKLAPFAAKRMILTGTPAPHSLYDLWNQFRYLWPGEVGTILGNRTAFERLIQDTPHPAREVRNRLRRFYHRTTQKELGLPSPRTHFVKLTPKQMPQEQANIIRLLEIRILAEANALVTGPRDREWLARWRRARMIRLLQASSNPGLLLSRGSWLSPDVGDVETGDLAADVLRFARGDLLPAKVAWSVAKARQLVGRGEKVVIWTWWVDNLRLLAKLLEDFHPLLVYGEIKPYQEDWQDPQEVSREKNIEDFRSRTDRQVLLANPAACAESISLHRECHNAIYVDRTFNCGQFLQSLNRIHRVGLPEGSHTAYWLPYVDCAVERSVNQRLLTRQQVMYEFLSDDASPVANDPTEESDVADNLTEVNEGFEIVINEIRRDLSHAGA